MEKLDFLNKIGIDTKPGFLKKRWRLKPNLDFSNKTEIEYNVQCNLVSGKIRLEFEILSRNWDKIQMELHISKE